MPDLLLKPLPPAEAVRFFDRKGFKIGFDWRDVFQQEHTRAFTVAKVMRQDLLEDIRAEVRKGLADGIPFETFRRQITPLLRRKGWWGRRTVRDPLTGELVEAQLGSPRRLRTIFDTNLRSARSAGRWERIQRNKLRRPYLRYSAVLDSKTRPQHRAWHSIILPVDHPFWDKYHPPNGWNCRCVVQQLSQRDLDRRGLTVSSDEEVGRFLRQTKTFQNKRTGERLTVQRGIDPGFNFNIGKEHMRGLAQSLESSLAVADPEIARQTLTAFLNSEGFSAFLASPERWGRIPVMLIGENLRRRIGAKTPVMNLSADTLQKQRQVHPEITEADYRSLAMIGADPDLVIRESSRTLVLVREGDKWLVAAVKATRTGKAGFVTSVRRTTQSDVERLKRRGRVVLRKKN